MNSPLAHSKSTGVLRYFLALGPALIVASVVLGPGSILTSSQVGATYGYSMVWVLALAASLMAGMTALGAMIGVSLDRSPGDELAARLGRPVAAMIGACVFLICACFQFGNNLGVLAAIDPLMRGIDLTPRQSLLAQIALLVVLNVMAAAAMYGLKHLYRPIEKLMMILVGMMLLGFASNLILAQPSLPALAQGLVPKLPAAQSNAGQGLLQESLLPVLGLFATTFSVAGAYYQAYLVREKGWTIANVKQGFVDSLAGISVLGGISLMIMGTSAAVLHGRVSAAELKSISDVALQLEPLFGPWATVLFCLGIFAGAFSSFLMNAMIGGAMLADGLGLGARMDGRYAKLFTLLALVMGMVVASAMMIFGREGLVPLIVLAQAMTVIGLPPLAAAMLYLLYCGKQHTRRSRAILTVIGCLGLCAALAVAVPTVVKLAEKLAKENPKSEAPR